MKVTLINKTENAVEMLLFTKATRLEMTPNLMETIMALPESSKMHDLKYVANTLPSSWEFVDYTFLVEGVSRAYTHQQVRTRTGSYAQQAMRVVDMGEFEYVFTDKDKQNSDAIEVISITIDKIKKAYSALLDLGMRREDARGILPTNIATNIVCKFNLRVLADLVKSRAGGRTQSEYKSVINAMVDCVLAVHPWASDFLFKHERNYFEELEQWATDTFGDDLMKKNELLKIVDHMRKEK
jgi:thymidylate synthase (FAD)